MLGCIPHIQSLYFKYSNCILYPLSPICCAIFKQVKLCDSVEENLFWRVQALSIVPLSNGPGLLISVTQCKWSQTMNICGILLFRQSTNVVQYMKNQQVVKLSWYETTKHDHKKSPKLKYIFGLALFRHEAETDNVAQLYYLQQLLCDFMVVQFKMYFYSQPTSSYCNPSKKVILLALSWQVDCCTLLTWA